MLRIRFEPQDLGRVRLVPEPDPLWELVLSLAQLSRPWPAGAAHETWQAQARLATASGLARRARDLLSALVPAKGDFPDFLTPVAGRDGLDAGLEAIRELPRDVLHNDLVAASGGAEHVPRWAHGLAEGDRDARTLLDVALREYFRAALEPHWHVIRQHVVADRSARTQQSTVLGVDALLSELSPGIRWHWPVLEADYPHDRVLELRGRGLVLIPSFFCELTPVTFIDEDLPPVLVYPASWARPADEPGPVVAAALVNVLGRTRANILLVLRQPCSTTDLAARIAMSVASASHHVGLLRDAGLVRTTRTGPSVRHQLTPLGYALLDAPERVRGELLFKHA